MSEKLLWAVQALTKADFLARPQMLRCIADKCGEDCKAVYDSALSDDNPKARLAALEIYRRLFPGELPEALDRLTGDRDWRVRRRVRKLRKETE